MNKLKIWKPGKQWDESEAAWDESAAKASQECPLKTLKNLPDMPGITPDTAKGLKWKSLKYMLFHDQDGAVRRGVLRHPFKHLKKYVQSLFQKSKFGREGDFFLYGVKTIPAYSTLLQDPSSIFILGFSYCHKPFECPSGRFSDRCVADASHAVCRQCFIGKAVHATPERQSQILFIPTVHYIGAKIFDIQEQYPNRPILFLITACELTLNMFADWGNMAGIQGIGVRLDGRICNTMKAFELSEKGIKPGLTVVLDATQKNMLDLIRVRRKAMGED